MEILGSFGFKPELFLAQIINFLILAYIFKRFLYKPVVSMIKTREKRIEQGLKDAEKAEKVKMEAEAERDKVLTKASKEAQLIVAETKASAEKMRDEILEKTKKDAERIVNEAQEQARLELESVRRQAKTISLELSEKILSQTLQNTFTKDEQKKIIARSLKEVEKYEHTRN